MSKPVFAEPGGSSQQVGGTLPDGWVQMAEQRPSPQHVAQEDGTWLDNSAAHLRQHYTQVIQDHLDTKAQERNYDGILSLCTYATSGNATFAAEGQAGVEWRDAVWATGYSLLDQVMTGQMPVPTEEELIGMLPEFSWPDEIEDSE